ncbi:hypothetical protein RDABS01_015504 [Bienertia sinuspersici]
MSNTTTSSSSKTTHTYRNAALTAPQNPCTEFFFTVTPVTRPETLIRLLKQSWENAAINSPSKPLYRILLHRNPGNPTRTLIRLLKQSWEYDPLTTLKLICYLRTLKPDTLSSNEGFYVAALWLHKNHPLTLACNLREFAGFGSLRDFSEILYRLVNEGENANAECNEKMAVARRAVCRYVQDPGYRFLHERVSDMFADLLRSDFETLKNGNVEELSFAARDCPSIDSSYDRHTLLCESIAKKVFPRESDPDYLGIEEVHYVYRVRSRLRKDVLAPLRSASEKEAQRKQKGDEDVSDCTLIFMKKAYQKMLKMKDDASKKRYYRNIMSMILKASDQCLPLTPPSIIASLKKEENIEVKAMEWQNMVQSFSNRSKLSNSVAVCDISDEMKETTRNVSISMGLLISELNSNASWKGTVYGFHESPELYKIKGNDLQSKVNFMKQIKCSDRVDIETILNQVLQVGVAQKLSKEKMVDRVFVFTNKDFRKALQNCWGWNYRAVWDNYQKFGYDQVPEVVFWNVEGFHECPPTVRAAIHNTIVTINGFSRSLFAFFLDKDAVWRSQEIKSITIAEDVMRITLSGKGYQNFAVLD